MTHHGTLDAETFARLVEYAMGNLREKEEREVRAHLKVCHACCDEVAWLQPTPPTATSSSPRRRSCGGVWRGGASYRSAAAASICWPGWTTTGAS